MPAYDFANVMAEVGDFDSWGLKMALMPNTVNKRVSVLKCFLAIILIIGSNSVLR
jgi:hypothetical protein